MSSAEENDAVTGEGEQTLFSKGSVVEVSSDQEGFDGAWYVATVIRPPPRQPPSTTDTASLVGRRYQVQYQTLLEDEDTSEPLRELVDVSFLRPIFPAEDDRDHSFAINDVVDAFHRDGWWTGVITTVVVEGGGDRDSKYVVWFKSPPEEIRFARSDLRVHRDWVGGKWVRPDPDSKEIIKLLSDHQEQLGHAINFPKNAETPIQPKRSFKSTKKKHKPATPDTSAMSSRPLKRLRKQNIEEATLSLTPCENMTTPIRSLRKAALSGLITSATGGTRSDCSKKSVEIINPLSDSQEQLGHTLNDPKNAEMPIRLKSSFKSTMKKHKPATPDTSAMSSRPLKRLRKQNTEEAPLSLTLCENMTTPIQSSSKEALSGLTTSATRGTRSDCSKKSVVGDSLFAKTKSSPGKKFATEQQKVHGLDSQRIKFIWKKGQKQRPQSESTKASATGFESKGRSSVQSENLRWLSDEACLKLMRYDQELKNYKETSEPKVGERSDRKRRGRPPKLAIEEPKEDETSSQRGKEGKPPKSLIEELVEGSEDGIRSKTPDVSETDYSTKVVEQVIDDLHRNVLDDQPLLEWIGGMDSRTVEDSRVSPGTIVNQCDEASARQDEIEIHSPPIASNIDQYAEASERQDGIAMQCTTVSDSGDIAVDKNQGLPFQKCSPIWESVESLEVFKIMPQKPHFRPLDDCKEDLREGLAIGKMVTFANLVERTSKLQHTDPKSIIDQSLETLSDLKIHGFDIESVQTRLNELLLTKERREQLEEELKEVERKIANHNLESNKLDEEIQEIAKMIKELQERLEFAKAKKEMVDWGTLRLKSTLVLISESLRKVPFDFEKLAASL